MNIFPSDFPPRRPVRQNAFTPGWAIALLVTGMVLGYMIGLWQQATQKNAAFASTAEVQQ